MAIYSWILLIYLLKMVMFHSYVSSPQGSYLKGAHIGVATPGGTALLGLDYEATLQVRPAMSGISTPLWWVWGTLLGKNGDSSLNNVMGLGKLGSWHDFTLKSPWLVRTYVDLATKDVDFSNKKGMLVDTPALLQILRHQQRVENIKPSAAVQRQEQERSLAKGSLL